MNLAGFAGIVSILIGGILLCTVLFQQIALYVLNNGLLNLHH